MYFIHRCKVPALCIPMGHKLYQHCAWGARPSAGTIMTVKLYLMFPKVFFFTWGVYMYTFSNIRWHSSKWQMGSFSTLSIKVFITSCRNSINSISNAHWSAYWGIDFSLESLASPQYVLIIIVVWDHWWNSLCSAQLITHVHKGKKRGNHKESLRNGNKTVIKVSFCKHQ